MSYRPAHYANPIFEEMERIFGLDEDLKRHAGSGLRTRPKLPEPKHV